jgi:outer membrane protein
LRLAPWYVSSGVNTGSHGNHAELGGGIGFPVSNSDRLRFGVNLNWGDNKYNQTYSGVTTEQSIVSGNVVATYYASAGIKDYAFTANWMHDIDKAWFSSTGLSYKLLTGPAEQSPLTQSSNAASMNLLLGYRF